MTFCCKICWRSGKPFAAELKAGGRRPGPALGKPSAAVAPLRPARPLAGWFRRCPAGPKPVRRHEPAGTRLFSRCVLAIVMPARWAGVNGIVAGCIAQGLDDGSVPPHPWPAQTGRARQVLAGLLGWLLSAGVGLLKTMGTGWARKWPGPELRKACREISPGPHRSHAAGQHPGEDAPNDFAPEIVQAVHAAQDDTRPGRSGLRIRRCPGRRRSFLLATQAAASAICRRSFRIGSHEHVSDR